MVIFVALLAIVFLVVVALVVILLGVLLLVVEGNPTFILCNQLFAGDHGLL